MSLKSKITMGSAQHRRYDDSSPKNEVFTTGWEQSNTADVTEASLTFGDLTIWHLFCWTAECSWQLLTYQVVDPGSARLATVGRVLKGNWATWVFEWHYSLSDVMEQHGYYLLNVEMHFLIDERARRRGKQNVPITRDFSRHSDTDTELASETKCPCQVTQCVTKSQQMFPERFILLCLFK